MDQFAINAGLMETLRTNNQRLGDTLKYYLGYTV